MTPADAPRSARRKLLTTEERAVINRANIEKRWAPLRAERLAAGKLPTREMEDGRAPRFLDPLTEPIFMKQAEDEGLVTEGMNRTAHRLLAKRLADAATQEAAQRKESGLAAPEGSSAAVVVVYWERELDRWQRRAFRDQAAAERDLDFAFQAESKLAQARLDLEAGK